MFPRYEVWYNYRFDLLGLVKENPTIAFLIADNIHLRVYSLFNLQANGWVYIGEFE